MVGHDEGFGIVRAGGMLIPLSLEEVEFCLERKGEGEGGVEGVGGEFEGKPNSVRALRITELQVLWASMSFIAT